MAAGAVAITGRCNRLDARQLGDQVAHVSQPIPRYPDRSTDRTIPLSCAPIPLSCYPDRSIDRPHALGIPFLLARRKARRRRSSAVDGAVSADAVIAV